MKTKAVRLHGTMDLRLDEFELPELSGNEILVNFITDSLCASTYKAVKLGTKHKRVPPDVAENPVMVGHEMCGVIAKIGVKVDKKWKIGQKITNQTALKLESGYDPGYSYPYIGGASTYAIVPELVLNLYRIHYDGIHVLGTGGSIPQDMRDVLGLIESNAIRPQALISHILGMNAYVDTMMDMATPSGAKKLCYTGLDIPLIAIDELDMWAEKDPLYAELAKIVASNDGLWCVEAEEYLLKHAPKI